MRLTVAVPPLHRSSLEAGLGHEVARAVIWADAGPADVVLGAAGEGGLAQCRAWPGLEGALALVRAGFERLRDRNDMEHLHEIGRALSSEQNLDRLLDLILTHGRDLVQAEAGSIYLVMQGSAGLELLFAHTQNAKVSLPFHRQQGPIARGTLSGFVALTGETLNLPDVYGIPADSPYRFNDGFDRISGYHSTSMLVVPLQDTRGEILGVLQFINRIDPADGAPVIVAFTPEHERLAQSLAGQAAVAVKNAKHREEIEKLFEGFVNASVTAIEQRDPVTSGHSGRVASLTVGLAEAINATPSGLLGGVFFSDRQLREIRYASLLHDFGKVGVREQVLVKAEKLDGKQKDILLQRLRQRQFEQMLEQVRRDWALGRAFDPGRWSALLAKQEADTEQFMTTIIQSNRPTVLTEDVAQDLGRLAALEYTNFDGSRKALLEAPDLACLSIRKGSLSVAEREEIESHVTHTFNFLQLIPWTSDLAAVPDIAHAHHERLNGKGYPRALEAPAIPLQSKAMAITDVYDALTAQDRPYKKAVPLERSLGILEEDARSGHLDGDLLNLFIEAKVYERTMP